MPFLNFDHVREILFVLFIIAIGSCQSESSTSPSSEDAYKTFQNILIKAQDGDTIDLQEGLFIFSRSLLIEGKKNIWIRGAGQDKTILSFAGQNSGAEGIKVFHCQNIKLSDFTIEDAKGDNIKISESQGVWLDQIRSHWTAPANEKNGAYAIYPVLCKNILIERCTASRASDAGIYVGQSDSVIIRNCLAYENVAGIESENSRFVEIYDNTAMNNTGGILVFDLPGLTQYGRHIRVYQNQITENNHKNFAPKGNIVGMVPPGTGLMILASRDIDIADNTILNHKTASMAIISYETIIALESLNRSSGNAQAHNDNYKIDSLYNPFPSNIMIFDNKISSNKKIPSLKNPIGRLLFWKCWFNTPQIIFDGFINPNKPHDKVLCIDHTVDKNFVNLDIPHEFEKLSRNLKPYRCMREKLEKINFKISLSKDENRISL